MIEALLLAAFLHRPVAIVKAVYQQGGIDAVAVVECESNFVPTAIRKEPRGFTSWGLFQEDSEWYPQHRGDLNQHIALGVGILQRRMAMAHGVFSIAVAMYNGGKHPEAYSLAWGNYVQKKRGEMMRYLRFRMTKDFLLTAK